ncbi:MAG: metallophosphoesterase [Rhodospirillales bacterium]|nr:metallophosphoesterase [Rhodospirillales bacterium]
MLEKLRGYISNGDETAVLALGSQPYRVTEPVRIAFDGRPIELLLGKKKLHLRPEIGVVPEPGPGSKDWILLDPERFYTEVAGFERLESGKKILVGRANERLDRIFNFPKSVMKRHLTLVNDNGQILVKPLDKETEVYVSCVGDRGEIDRLKSLNLSNLKHLREIFGGPIELLSPDEALATLEQAIEVLGDEPYRAKDSRGRPGGVLELPGKPVPVIVGDLHAEVDNLLKILSVDRYLEGLESGDAMLLLLGDLVHSQARDALEEMDSSLLMLDLVFKLKVRFPARVFCLRGNHETLDESVGKGGVPQGLILQEKAQALRGTKYVARLAECFELLPYVVKTDDFIATHAGPTRSRGTLQDLIDIRDHPQLAWQLTWNRLQRPTRPAGYTKKDVKAFRARLGAEKGTPLIVSHTPLSLEGTIWTNAGEIKNHHVVYSANQDRLAVFIRVGREMVPLEYPAEHILEFANRLDLDRQ